MIDVGRNDRATTGDLVAHELGSDVLRHGRAEAFKKKTEEAIAAYEAALADARAKALRTVEETRKKASDAMEEKRKASEAKLDKRLREAESHINATKE